MKNGEDLFKSQIQTSVEEKDSINLKLKQWPGLYETVSGWVNFNENLPLTTEDVVGIMVDDEKAHNAFVEYFSEEGEGFKKQPEFSRDKVLQFQELVILELRGRLNAIEKK